MFLDVDKAQAQRDKNEINMCLLRARRAFGRDKYDNSITELNNAIQHLNELKRLKNKKEMDDRAWLILKQIESERQQKELLHNMRGRYL